MDVVRIRPYKPPDEAAVRRLSPRLTEGFAPWRESAKVEATISGWIDAALGKHDETDHVVLVAEIDDRGVVGFIAANAQQHYIDGRDGYIGELAVDEAAEGHGVGRQLVAAVTEWARTQDCGRLTLQTGAANERARRFYEQLGFEYEDVSLARPI